MLEKRNIVMFDFKSILPPNSTKLERDLEYIGIKVEQMPVPFVALSRIDDCPERYLPWLAWSHRVEYWNPEWSVEQKRQAIRHARTFNQQRGTASSIRHLIDTVAGKYRLVAWHEMKPKGVPYTFIVQVDKQQILTVDELATLHTAIDATKSQRDLYAIDAKIKTETLMYIGGFSTQAERIYLAQK